MSSVSQVCITPLQDCLELGGEARMNFPGTQTSANWTWRAKTGAITGKLATKLRKMTVLYGRMANENEVGEK